MKHNLFALIVLLLLLVGLPAAIFAYRTARDTADGLRVIEIQAQAPEAGGFIPDRLELTAGETVKLRVVSPDVVHSFFIPELGVNIDEVYPGKPVEVTITPQEPGRYAFACTRWCSVDHWRMRGVIEVLPADAATQSTQSAETSKKPLFEQLGIDLDAMRHAPTALPAATPSAARGAALARRGTEPGAPASPARPPFEDVQARKRVSPADAFLELRAAPENAGLSDDQVWDLVAWAWLQDVSPETLAQAQTLYSRDCAACHGETGQGDGVAGENLPGLAKMDPAMRRGPADFTDAGQMLSAPDALLHGKILRGGMGTGMPEFGSLYTDAELWAMVSYLRTFLFTK